MAPTTSQPANSIVVERPPNAPAGRERQEERPRDGVHSHHDEERRAQDGLPGLGVQHQSIARGLPAVVLLGDEQVSDDRLVDVGRRERQGPPQEFHDLLEARGEVDEVRHRQEATVELLEHSLDDLIDGEQGAGFGEVRFDLLDPVGDLIRRNLARVDHVGDDGDVSRLDQVEDVPDQEPPCLHE
ncbi:hypothetical protein ACFQMM_18395 [Saliphagus sp. GCM10025308]